MDPVLKKSLNFFAPFLKYRKCYHAGCTFEKSLTESGQTFLAKSGKFHCWFFSKTHCNKQKSFFKTHLCSQTSSSSGGKNAKSDPFFSKPFPQKTTCSAKKVIFHCFSRFCIDSVRDFWPKYRKRGPKTDLGQKKPIFDPDLGRSRRRAFFLGFGQKTLKNRFGFWWFLGAVLGDFSHRAFFLLFGQKVQKNRIFFGKNTKITKFSLKKQCFLDRFCCAIVGSMICARILPFLATSGERFLGASRTHFGGRPRPLFWTIFSKKALFVLTFSQTARRILVPKPDQKLVRRLQNRWFWGKKSDFWPFWPFLAISARLDSQRFGPVATTPSFPGFSGGSRVGLVGFFRFLGP